MFTSPLVRTADSPDAVLIGALAVLQYREIAPADIRAFNCIENRGVFSPCFTAPVWLFQRRLGGLRDTVLVELVELAEVRIGDKVHDAPVKGNVRGKKRGNIASVRELFLDVQVLPEMSDSLNPRRCTALLPTATRVWNVFLRSSSVMWCS